MQTLSQTAETLAILATQEHASWPDADRLRDWIEGNLGAARNADPMTLDWLTVALIRKLHLT